MKGVPGKFEGRFMAVSSMLEGSVKYVSRKFKNVSSRFQIVYMRFQGYLKEV